MESAQLKTRSIMEQAVEENVWGIASAIDVYECDPESIRSAEKIRTVRGRTLCPHRHEAFSGHRNRKLW